MSSSKYIVYKTRGGFTDTMNQIWRCLEYARAHNRTLVIDATHDWMKADLRNYITIHDSHIYTGSLTDFYNEACTRTIFPPQACQNLQGYYPGYYDSWSILPLDKVYTEDIIVHTHCGGGASLPSCLSISTASRTIKDVFLYRLSLLPPNYISIHVRNTDYKSDVAAFLNENAAHFSNKDIFLASDDIYTIRHFQELYGSRVYSFANIPETKDGENIHDHHASISNDEFIVDTIVDMMVLAYGSEFYGSSRQSGYTKSAHALFNNKHIVRTFLGI